VARFEALIRKLEAEREDLRAQRARLLAKLH
jgi:hypothetical protein